MADFDYLDWGNTKIVGKWVLETGESGVYRGQCTQVVTQLLKDLGYTGWNVARGNGNQVGAYMVANGEATFEGTNLASVPSGEIHIVCLQVGNTATAGHVSVAAAGDIIYEQNVTIAGLPTHNYGVGNTYPGRLGRLAEAFRTTRYHYKLTVATDFDNVTGDGGGVPDPTDDPIGPNQNRFIRERNIQIKKSKTAQNNAVKNHKNFQTFRKTQRGIQQSN